MKPCSGQKSQQMYFRQPRDARCAQRFHGAQQRETLVPHEVPQGPWEKLGIDFFEFQSIKYLLIADYYSRFPVTRKVRSTTASATIDTLKQVFSEYGVPKTVMSDNGPPFSSKEFESFATKHRALLPARSLMQNAHDQIVREQMVKGKNKASLQYNKASKDLPVLPQSLRSN